MATANRWRIAARGVYTTGAWTGEEAQIGLGGIASDSDFNFITPAIDTGLPTFTANPGGGVEIVAGLGTVNYGSEGTGGNGWVKASQKAHATAMRAYLDSLKAAWSNAFRWTEIRLSAIDAAGDVINGATVVTLETAVVGTDASQDLPPQTAIVQSLVTSGRGSRNRGRWYVPAHSSSQVASGGTVGTTFMDTMNTAAKTLVTAINASARAKAVVVSPTHQSFSDIITFKVGNRFDTQRRRMTGIPETFNTLAA